MFGFQSFLSSRRPGGGSGPGARLHNAFLLGPWAPSPSTDSPLFRHVPLLQGERPEEGVAGGLNRNQGLNRLMLAVRDMMANFHLNDLEAPHEDDADGEGEWD